eukprot:6590445-Pyramimonas_sp.AAC.1
MLACQRRYRLCPSCPPYPAQPATGHSLKYVAPTPSSGTSDPSVKIWFPGGNRSSAVRAGTSCGMPVPPGPVTIVPSYCLVPTKKSDRSINALFPLLCPSVYAHSRPTGLAPIRLPASSIRLLSPCVYASRPASLAISSTSTCQLAVLVFLTSPYQWSGGRKAKVPLANLASTRTVGWLSRLIYLALPHRGYTARMNVGVGDSADHTAHGSAFSSSGSSYSGFMYAHPQNLVE